MSGKKEWLLVEVEELINIYFNKTYLWDVASKDYKDKDKRRDAYAEMALCFNTTYEEINRKIHNLRNQFNSELKKMKSKNSGQATNSLYVSKWPFFKSLSFLQGSLSSRATPGNVVEPNDVADSLNGEESDEHAVTEQLQDINSMNSLWNPNTCSEVENIPKNLHKNTTKQHDFLLQKAAALVLSQEKDQYDVFGNYVASEMRNLKSEYLRRRMKRKIQQVMLDISEEEEQLIVSTPRTCYSNEPSSNSSGSNH